MDNGTETGLALDDGVGNTHLAAESGKEDNQLNGVNVVSDEDKRSLLVLNEADDVVQTVLDMVGLLGDILLLLALGDSGGLSVQTLLLLDLSLRTVLVQELEGLSSGVAVQGVLELSDGRRDLQTHVEDLLLALKTDILGPLDETAEVALGLDVLANTEVAGALLDERVLRVLLGKFLHFSEQSIFFFDIPWGPSCWRQPYPGGKAWEQSSFRTWEAIIEKRRSANRVHHVLHLL